MTFWIHEWDERGTKSGLNAEVYFGHSLEVAKIQNITKILNNMLLFPLTTMLDIPCQIF